jgi:hypothetical protein
MEGHPRMQQQPKRQRQRQPQPQDGSNHKEEENKESYDFELYQEYGIFQHEWTLLVDFFSPACLEPTTTDDWDRLKRVATVLGGSDSVDTAYKLVQYNRIVLPQDDVHDVYSWISVRTGDVHGHDAELVRQRIAVGYKLVYEEPYHWGSGGNRYLQHYRMRKLSHQTSDRQAVEEKQINGNS